jgi:hypothetical protein
MDHNNIEFEFVLRASCKISNFTDINNKKLKVIEIDNYDSLTAYQTWSGDTLFLNNRKRKVFGLDLDYFFNAVEMFNNDREYELQYRPTLVVRRQNSHSHHNSHTFLNVVSFNSYVNENKGDDEECNTCIGGFNLYRTFKIYCDNNFTHLDFSVDGEKINKELINTLEGETIALTINFSPLPYSDIDFLPGREYTPFDESAHFGETIKNKDTNMFSAASNTSIVTSLTSKEFPSVEGYPQKTFNFILKDHGKIIYKNRRKCIVIKNPKMIEAYQIWNKASKSIHQDRRILKYITGGELAAAASRINSYLFTGNTTSSYSLFKFTPSAYLSIEGKEYYIVIDKIVHNSSTNNNEDGAYDMDVAAELIFYLDELSFTYANGEVLEEVPTFYTKKPIYINIDPTPDPSNINHNDTNNALSSLGYQVLSYMSVKKPNGINMEYLLPLPPKSDTTTISKSVKDENKVRILPKQHVRGRNISKNHSGPKKKPKQFKFDKKLFEEKKNVRRVKSRNVVYDSPQNVDEEVCPFPNIDNLSFTPGKMTPCYHVKVMGSVDQELPVDNETNPPVFYLKPNTSDKYFKQPHLKLFKGMTYIFDLSDPSLLNTSTNIIYNFQIFNGASFDSDDNLSPITHIRGGTPGQQGAYIIFTIQNTMYTYEDYSIEDLNFTYGNYTTSLESKEPLYPNMGGNINVYSRETIRKRLFKRRYDIEDYDLPRLKPNPDPNDPNLVLQDGSDIKNFTISFMLSFLSAMIREVPLLNIGTQEDNTEVEVQDVNSRSLGKPLTLVAKGKLARLLKRKGKADLSNMKDATGGEFGMFGGEATGMIRNPLVIAKRFRQMFGEDEEFQEQDGIVVGLADAGPADGGNEVPIRTESSVASTTRIGTYDSPAPPGPNAYLRPAVTDADVPGSELAGGLRAMGVQDDAAAASLGYAQEPSAEGASSLFLVVRGNGDQLFSIPVQQDPAYKGDQSSIFDTRGNPQAGVAPENREVDASGYPTGRSKVKEPTVADLAKSRPELFGGGGRLDGEVTAEELALANPDLFQGVPEFAKEIMRAGGAAPFDSQTTGALSSVLNRVSIPPEQHQGERWTKDGVLYLYDARKNETRLANSIVTNPEKPQSGDLDALPNIIQGKPPLGEGWSKVDESANTKLYHAEIELPNASIKEVILVNNPVLLGNLNEALNPRTMSTREIPDPRSYFATQSAEASGVTLLEPGEAETVFRYVASAISSTEEVVVRKEILLEILDDFIANGPPPIDDEDYEETDLDGNRVAQALKQDINSGVIEQFNYSFIKLSDVKRDIHRKFRSVPEDQVTLWVNGYLRPPALESNILGKIEDYSMLNDKRLYIDIEGNFKSLISESIFLQDITLYPKESGDSINLYSDPDGLSIPVYSISLSDVRKGVTDTFSDFLSNTNSERILKLANDLNGGLGIDDYSLKKAYDQSLKRYLELKLLGNINTNILSSTPEEKREDLVKILKPTLLGDVPGPDTGTLIDSSFSLLSNSKTFLDIQRKANYNVDLYVNGLVDELTPVIGEQLRELQVEWTGVREFTNEQVMEIRTIIETAIRETPISDDIDITNPLITTDQITQQYLEDVIETFEGNINELVAKQIESSTENLIQELKKQKPSLTDEQAENAAKEITETLINGTNIKDFYSVVDGKKPTYEENEYGEVMVP